MHDFFQKGETVHAGHFHIQSNDIWTGLNDLVPGHVRIGGSPHHFQVRLPGKNLAENFPHDGGIIHDQDPKLFHDS